MSSSPDQTDDPDVLEQNVSHLLEGGGEPPRIADPARAKIRAQLIARHGREAVAAPRRSPLLAIGLGLVATAAAAAIVTRFADGGDGGGGEGVVAPATDGGKLADGSSWIVERGATLSVIGPRHVRVEGAVLLDVAPGKGTFVVDTTHGRIEVLGTRFLVAADQLRTTAAVVRGTVKLAGTQGEGDVVLHAGEQGVAEPGRPPTRGPAPRLSHLVSWAREARHKDEHHTVQPIHRGTLFAKDPGVRSHPPWGDEYPLPMTRLQVDVVVENQVARVALDQTFHNAENQDLEGTYRFAIPADAALQRLAMYVEGNLMESAVVERMQARRIYEDLVYRRVDPALLEWAGTGRLNLRIFPIPARQDKRIMLAYTQSLPKLYADYAVSIPFPELDAPVGELAFDVRVKGCGACELSSTSHQIAQTRDGDDAVITYRKTNERIGDSLVLHVRDPRTEPTVATAGSGDARYVMVRAPSQLGGEPRAYRPRTWVILDDVSASRGAMERRAQADLVDAFLRELDEHDRVAIVAFDVVTRQILAPTRVLDVDRKAVRAALATEGGVGATDFTAALDAATRLLAAVTPDDAMIVYVGDGVITSGARKLDALRAQISGKAHFVGVGIGDGADTQTLEALAGATGGFATTIDLADDVGWRAFDLVAALHTSRVTNVDARLVDANGTLVPATLYARSPQLADGEEIELVAKLAGDGVPVAAILRGTRDGKDWTQRITFPLPPHPSGPLARDPNGFLPRLWAQRHVAARMLAKHEAVVVPPCIETKPAARTAPMVATKAAGCLTEAQVRQARDEVIRQEVVALGKQYFLLSRHTSLLVLENDVMYTQYGVTKGAGDTWAPYAMPAKIPVVVAKLARTPTNVAGDAELVRAPLPTFYDYSSYYKNRQDFERDRWAFAGEDVAGGFGLLGARATPSAVTGAAAETRSELGLVGKADAPRESSERKAATRAVNEVFDGQPAITATITTELAKQQRVTSTDELTGLGPMRGGRGTGSGYGMGGGRVSRHGWHNQQQVSLLRFGHPRDVAFDDITGFVPALQRDGFDAWRAELGAGKASVDRPAPGRLDDAAKVALARARAALPAGVYRWDEFEIAVDAQRHLGWRRITDANLHETAAFDGVTWTRRYAELGLEVTRAVGDDDVALNLAYLPILIAEPGHWARWFDVGMQGPRQVTLSTLTERTSRVVFILQLDDHDRLVAITDGNGKQLAAITWDARGPIAARVFGADVDVGFIPQAVGDAAAWAHQGAQAQPVVVELPGRLVAYAQDTVKAHTPGSPSWRHAQRQLMASYAAMQDRGGLARVHGELVANGGAELGDLVLASAGIATATSDKAFATALAPYGKAPGRQVLARYLAAGRAYGQDQRPTAFAHPTEGGLVAQLFTLREASAKLQAGQGKAAVDALLTLDGRATQLRVIGAAAAAQRYDVKPEEIARAWENAAIGPMKNVARGHAAQALFTRGMYDAGVERVAALIADLDLRALPPQIDQAPYMFNSSRRGPAGWQIAWAMWRERVMASDSYEHVMALLPVAQQAPGDIPAILARGAALAHGDAERLVSIAQIAVSRGQSVWAQTLIDPLLASRPSRELFQLAASIALAQGKPDVALAHLEAAQAAAADDAVDVNLIRSELGQILQVARQVAIQSSGASRDAAIKTALAWGAKWRAVDEGNPAIDQQLGELLLAVGDTAGAWRQLSTVIERDPMAGYSYTIVAEAFERQGRVTDALDYWQQAVVIDQTNPMPRLRKAQALIALGRTAEGDALLADIVHRTWHDIHSNIVWQARNLIERGKPRNP